MPTEGRVVFSRWRVDLCGHTLEWISDLIGTDYMRRWQLRLPWCTLRLHHILRSDDDRDFHDHPMDFISLILSGGYIEHTPDGDQRRYLPGDLNRRKAEDLHRLELPDGPVWTFVLAKPFRRVWGFTTEDGWIAADEYDNYKRGKQH